MKILHQGDKDLLIAYRNCIVLACTAPRLDDINARFLVEELNDRIAEAVVDFDTRLALEYENKPE